MDGIAKFDLSPLLAQIPGAGPAASGQRPAPGRASHLPPAAQAGGPMRSITTAKLSTGVDAMPTDEAQKKTKHARRHAAFGLIRNEQMLRA
jgi:hypothetical protein